MAPEADFEDEEQKENDKILDGDSGANSDQEKEKTYKKEKDGLERTMSREFQMDKTYLKGTLIKYLEYAAKGEEKEALTLEKVLFTILGATSQDLDKL